MNLFRSVVEPRWHEIDGSRVARPRVLMDWMEHARSLVPADDSLHAPLNFGLARSIRLDTFAPIDTPAPVAVAVWLSHCGTTSYAMDHELTRVGDGAVVARARLVFVRMGADRRPAPVDPSVAGRVRGAPVELLQGRELGEPHGAPAFERAFQAVLNDENRGRHVGHTQVVDYLDDTWRLALLGAVQGAEPGMHWRQPRSIAVDYEGEAHAGDQLVARAWTTSEWASDAALDLTRPSDQRCIARARFLF
jgi:acyl-CoA thioesterase FadM